MLFCVCVCVYNGCYLFGMLGCFGGIRWRCEYSDIIIVVDEEVECMQRKICSGNWE